MIDGSYTGVSQGLDQWGHPEVHMPGVNAPASKLPGAGYNWNATPVGGITCCWTPAPMQYLEFGGVYPWGDDMENAVLSTQEAYNLDAKMDDGPPGTGNITTFNPSSGYNVNCATSSNAATAKYNLTYTGVACNLFIRMDF